MTTPKDTPKLPKLDWKTATCDVCGRSFEYLGKKRPHICKDGECIYKYQHQIDPHKWASYQPTLFD